MRRGSLLGATLVAVLGMAAVASDVRSAPARPALRGPCVDPEVDARVRPEPSADEPDPPGLWTEAAPDLDGDGHDDLRVAQSGWCGSGGCNPWSLYVIRGNCARYVGAVVGRNPTVVRRRADGWADLRAESHGGYCPYSETEYRFYRGSYHDVMDRWCDCDYSVRDRRDMPVRLEDGRIRCTRWRPSVTQ